MRRDHRRRCCGWWSRLALAGLFGGLSHGHGPGDSGAPRVPTCASSTSSVCLALTPRNAAVETTTTDPAWLPQRVPQLAPGVEVEGYALVERAALLGVCDHRRGDGNDHDGGEDDASAAADAPTPPSLAVTTSGSSRGELWPMAERQHGPRDEEDGDREQLPGPTLEYQCLLDDIDLIYINSNYRLRRKFAAGSHGEVWRATRATPVAGEEDPTPPVQPPQYILKRLFVERGERMVEMGMREAHFGAMLADERHVTRFVESFVLRTTTASAAPTTATADTASGSTASPVEVEIDVATTATPMEALAPRSLAAESSLSRLESHSSHSSPPPPIEEADAAHGDELWLVFHDEGISLRQYLYSTRESAHTAVLFEPSPFWSMLRADAAGEHVLREILRQLLEGVAALHARGITHRDIKPSNILVQPTSTTTPLVKLADFGSAVDEYTLRHLYGPAGPSQAEETREYQPPEVLFSAYGAPYDSAWPLAYDLWSVGVVFLEIVLGSPQVFLISPRARAKLDAHLRGRDEETRRKSYLLHVLTHEFCIFQPSPHELHALWNQYALVSDGCHFGRFNQTIVARDPLGKGLWDPWALDLMWKLLQWNPSQRISAREALQHAFFVGPYVCEATGRAFATRQELAIHEAYLAAQRQRDEEMALVVPPRYKIPESYRCPHCHRAFSTQPACERHLEARKHGDAARRHWCEHDDVALQRAIRAETAQLVRRVPLRSSTDVGVAVLQGKRRYMEDRVVIRSDPERRLTMYAIIDGHLGSRAADFVQDELFATLFGRLAASGIDDAPVYQQLSEHVVLRQVFLELHVAFVQSLTDDAVQDFSGCTLTVVLHFHEAKRLVSANVGDSRAVWIDQSGPTVGLLNLTTDHWPHVPSERARIESSGGFVSFEGLWRVVGQLAVSRSIGDAHLRKFITAEPAIVDVDLAGRRGVVVIASDGVWETLEGPDIATFAHEQLDAGRRDPQELAEAVVREAYLRGSLDNLALIWVQVEDPM